MVKTKSLKEKCDSCHSTKSKEFWSFEDEIVLCDNCNKEYGDELQKEINNQSKFVFTDSAGWLLFWLIVVPPVGYIWLIFGMKKGEVNLTNALKKIRHNKTNNDKIALPNKKISKKEMIMLFSISTLFVLIILLVALFN